MEQFDLVFTIEGMMCQKNCGTTVQSAISSLPFVKEAVASFEKASAYANLRNYENVDKYIHDIIDSVEGSGYGAVLAVNNISISSKDLRNSSHDSTAADNNNEAFDYTHPDISITVENMIGANDVRRIEDILTSSDGVFHVKINAVTKIVSVWGFADENELVKSLIIKGFQAMNTEQYQEKLRKEKQQKNSHLSSSTHIIKKVFLLNFTALPNHELRSINKLQSSLQKLNQELIRSAGIGNTSEENSPRTAETMKSIIDSNYDAITKQFKISFPSNYTFSRSGKYSRSTATSTLTLLEDSITDILKELNIFHYLVPQELSNVTQREFIYSIRGMSCGACSAKIEREIKKLPGVSNMSVSVMTQKGKVTIDETVRNAVGPRDVLDRINGIGYEANLLNSSTSEGQGSTSFSSTTIEAYEHELSQWKQLLIIAMLFGLPVIFFHFCSTVSEALETVLSKPSQLCHHTISNGQILMFILNFPILMIVGYKYYRSAMISAFHGIFGMDFLVMVGTSITFTYSLLELCFACYLQSPTTHVFFETTGMLLLFVTIGKYIEAYAKGRSASSIAELLKLQPREASLVTGESAQRLLESFHNQAPPTPALARATASNDSEDHPARHHRHHHNHVMINDEDVKCIDIDLIQRGDIVKILPGERIPTDGKVISGHSYVDESMITGESIPAHKKLHDSLFGSTVNQSHTMYMMVTSYGSESALAQIVRLVELAQMNKAPIQEYADRLAGIFTPIILLIAVSTFTVWLSLSYLKIVPPSWFIDEYDDPILFSLLFSISVVVISCPCALGLATPTAIMVGTTVGAQNGILIKGGSAFETAHKIDTIVFDKTGTLTRGKPFVTDMIPIYTEGELSTEQMKEKILLLAVTAEQNSDHPLAKAVQQHALNQRVQPLPLASENSSKSVVGSGVSCQCSAGKISIGNRKFMKQLEIPLSTVAESELWNLEIQGKTAVCIALNNIIYGIIGIADKPKDEAEVVLKLLKGMGMDIWMFTGDNATTAEALANTLEISLDRVLSGMLPEDKVNKVKELQSQGRTVAMIGDGINDSPALVQAHLGIAIGAGTQIAMESASMILIRSNLKDLVVAFDLAKVVFRRIQWNFLWAMIYNVVSIPFAAGVWFPWTKMLLPPHYAGLAMALSSISVVISSSMLRLYERPRSLQEFTTEEEEEYHHFLNRSDSFSSDEESDPRIPSIAVHKSKDSYFRKAYRRCCAFICCSSKSKTTNRSCSRSSCSYSLPCACCSCCGGNIFEGIYARRDESHEYNKLPVSEQEAEEFFGLELKNLNSSLRSEKKKQIWKFNEELEEFIV